MQSGLENMTEAAPKRASISIIVDDEQGMRQLLSLVFGRADHQVRAAESGAKALEMLRREPADLIISDVRMPDMNGIELLRAVREFLPEVAVVMMTAFATEIGRAHV